MTTLTYHDDPDFKARVVRAAEDHREADRFVQGEYLDTSDDEWRGCSVGCTVAPLLAAERGVPVTKVVGSRWHEEESRLLGIPEWLARVQDQIFEGLRDDHIEWTPRLLAAIPVGVSHESLGAARDEWLRDLLHDPERGAIPAAAQSLRRAGRDDSASDLERITRETPIGEVRSRCYTAANAADSHTTAAYVTSAAADAAVGVFYASNPDSTHAAAAAGAAAAAADDGAWWAWAGDAWWTWAGDRLLDRLTDTGADR